MVPTEGPPPITVPEDATQGEVDATTMVDLTAATGAAAAEVPPEILAQSFGQYLRGWSLKVKSGDSGILPVVLGLVGVAVVFEIVTPSHSFLRPSNVVYIIGLSTVYMVLAMAGRTTWNLVNVVIAVAVNLAVDLALIPRLGALGAAVGLAASIVANNLIPLAQVGLQQGQHLGPELAVALAAVRQDLCLGVFWRRQDGVEDEFHLLQGTGQFIL